MRLSLPSRFIITLLILCAAPLLGQTTGTWTGTYALVESGCPGTFHGPATLYVLQTGSSFTAVLDFELTFLEDCVPSTNRVMLPASGSVSGNDFSGIIVVPFGGEPAAPFNGTVDGNTMTVVSVQSETTVTLNLTRTSSDPPDAAVAGTYSGTYTLADTIGYDPCANLPLLSYSGPLTGTLLQGGEAISGVVDLRETKDTDHDESGNCTIIDGQDERVLFMGTLSGNVVTGALVAYDVVLPVTAAVSGNTISGAGGDAWRSFTFTMTRSTAAAGPVLLDFAADPPSIAPGQTATLRWAVFNAAAVSIDHGIGTKPATGTAVVAPASTTTYTLTATTNGMTVTAQTTVTVAPIPAPVILTFTATPATIAPGACSTLAWTTTNATSVSIDHGLGTQPLNGSTPVCPPTATTYKLTATGEGGSATSSVHVAVWQSCGRRRAVRH